MTSSWINILKNPGVSAPEAQTIVKEYVTNTVRGLVAGAPDGIPIAQSSITDVNIQDSSILGTSIALNTITEKNVVNGTFTGLSMALKTILVSGDTWSDNSPSAGSIAWSAFKISYDGTTTTIAAGNTINTYIYWDGASVTLTTSNTNPILGDNAFMIATNVSGTHSIAYNKIALLQIGAAWIQLASITDAQIASLNAGKITAGVIRSINSFSSTFGTKGSNLTQATVGSDTTVYVENAVDFPSSGSAQIIDTTNDRNTFTYTGTTPTSLTGCSGVLAHNNLAVVVPMVSNALLSQTRNQVRIFGDIGNYTIEEIITTNDLTYGGAILKAGSSTAGANSVGIRGISNSSFGVYGQSISSYGGYFTSDSLTGLYASGGGTNPGIYGTGYIGAHFHSNNVSGCAVELDLTTSGSQAILPNNGIWTPTEPGFYVWADANSTITGDIIQQVLVSSAWRGANSGGRCFYTDGSSVRLLNDDSMNTHTVWWIRF